METDPTRWIGELRSSHDVLVAVVADLLAEDLERPSMCRDWTVAQVLSHLGSGAVIGLASLDAGLRGEPLPGDELAHDVWGRWNAMGVEEAATEFVGADAALVERFESLDDIALVEARIRIAFLPEPIDIATSVSFRLGEHALHSWDVLASFDETAEVPESSAELLIDRLPTMVGLIGRYTPRDTRPADDVTIAVTTTHPDRSFELELGEHAELRATSISRSAQGAGELTLPAGALLRLTAGRLRPDRPSGDLQPTGPLSLDDLRRAFPGY